MIATFENSTAADCLKWRVGEEGRFVRKSFPDQSLGQEFPLSHLRSIPSLKLFLHLMWIALRSGHDHRQGASCRRVGRLCRAIKRDRLDRAPGGTVQLDVVRPGLSFR